MKDNLLYVLAGFIALATVGVIVLLLLMFPEQKELINQAVTALLTNFTLMIGYYFGSSKGSADKNEIIKDENKKTTP